MADDAERGRSEDAGRDGADDAFAGDSETTTDSDASGPPDERVGPAVPTDAGGSADAEAVESDASGERPGERGGRSEVVVPMALYKVVTVFSTLFAVAFVVGGMIALDVATGRATFDADEIRLPIAFLGVASIVLGAATYAFAARFRAEGMGNPKDRDDQP